MSCNTQMGLGQLGSPSLVVKRKFRWTAEFRDSKTWQVIVPATFVKMGSRPQLNIEETEINFLNEKTWIPGKKASQTIDITYWDMNNDEATALLMFWLGMQYNEKEPKIEMANVVIKLYDGCGYELERWYLQNGFIESVNFGELDYSSSDETTMEIKFRYNDVVYESEFDGKTPCVPSYIGTAGPYSMPGNYTLGGMGMGIGPINIPPGVPTKGYMKHEGSGNLLRAS